ncbi:BPSS1780 family membrane protein [Trinickia sp.]|uniref:BPSS1780 family membrane protein n=1 Tax=Trinickia sp. TaxID=2571163 RepID=UPI003F7EF305
MQLTEVSAKTGYVWFRQGIWLFRRNPLGFLTIFFTYLLAMMAISRVPLAGPVLSLLLIPGIAVGFMTACRDTIAGKIVFPTVLLDGFRSYGTAGAVRLLELGGIYVVAIALVVGGSALVDGGVLFKLIMGTEPVSSETLVASSLAMAELFAIGCYLPVAMLFWFAPVLAVWHDVPPVKAMFFSFVTCWRNRGAFIVFGALWLATAILVLFGILVLMLAVGAHDYAFAVLYPVSVTLSTVLYCSFYATYRGCYGVQEPNTGNGAPGTPGL